MSLAFSGYYLIYANEADEKVCSPSQNDADKCHSLTTTPLQTTQLRKFRAFCTVEMLRETWHKTGNPYVRAVTWFHRASLPVVRQLLLPRPALGAHHKRPTKAWLFYSKSEKQLREEEELILDFCGGGFSKSFAPSAHPSSNAMIDHLRNDARLVHSLHDPYASRRTSESMFRSSAWNDRR